MSRAVWAATPDTVARLLVDRTEADGGRFTDDTYPTVGQVQDLLDDHEIRVLIDVWDVDYELPERVHKMARLAHGYLVAALVENTFGEQVEQTQRAEFFNRRAQEYLALLRRVIGDMRRERNVAHRR